MATSADDAVAMTLDVLIPARDGVRLAANLYRPRGGDRCPCLVTYLPYHKDGRGGLGYDAIHRFFAARGFASLVVDFRGLGGSEGINNVPFDTQEGRDGHDAVEWAAAQPWCDGQVGMWGSSYGGITTLKTAAERPPHLRAIVPIHATTDNYLDFLLLGGCRNGFWPNGDWGPRMIGYNLTPPLGDDADGRLTKLWAERLQASRPWCLDWYDTANEQARWGERVIPVERIEAATFAVCGWHDFYVQGTLDYYRRLTAPKKLLMGPWKHAFPNLSTIEPMNLLELMVGWWDRWLRGQANGADAGPALTLFVQGTGVWRHEETWPPRRNQDHDWYLLPSRALSDRPSAEPAATVSYRGDPTVGLDSLGVDPWTTAVADPGDHNGDDARSLTFTTAPLPEDWDLTGRARVLLRVRTSGPGLNLVAKLCDVCADGRSQLVALGWSPGPTSSEGHVEIALRSTSHVFRRGHRLRLALALADFPRLWPTAQEGEIELLYPPGEPPRLLVPRTPPADPPLPAPKFSPCGPRPQSSFELESSQSWHVSRELVQTTASLRSCSRSRYRLRDGGTVTYDHEYTAQVAAANPAGTAIHVRSGVEVQRAGCTLHHPGTNRQRFHAHCCHDPCGNREGWQALLCSRLARRTGPVIDSTDIKEDNVMPVTEHAALLERYQDLRRTGMDLNQKLVKSLPRSILDDGARKLGMLEGNKLVLNNEFEFEVLMDFCLHDVRWEGRTAIQHFLAKSPPPEGSDEIILLRALLEARFSLFRVEGIEPGCGIRLRDLLNQESRFAMDVNLSLTAQDGLVLAGRIYAPEGIGFLTGAAMPRGVISLAERTKLVQKVLARYRSPDPRHPTPEDASAVAGAILRSFLKHGAAQHIIYKAPPTSPEDRMPPMPAQPPPASYRVGRNDPCPCGSGRKYKACCGGPGT